MSQSLKLAPPIVIPIVEFLKAVYYTVEVHNFDLQEKATSTLNNNKFC